MEFHLPLFMFIRTLIILSIFMLSACVSDPNTYPPNTTTTGSLNQTGITIDSGSQDHQPPLVEDLS